MPSGQPITSIGQTAYPNAKVGCDGISSLLLNSLFKHLLVDAVHLASHGQENVTLTRRERLAKGPDAVKVAVSSVKTSVARRWDLFIKAAWSELMFNFRRTLLRHGLMFGLHGRKGFIHHIQFSRAIGVERNHAHELLAEAFLIAIPAYIGAIKRGLAERACSR